MVIRYDEEVDETGFDDRSHDDDIEKGQIKFSQSKLYGRGDELERLHSIYNRLFDRDRPHKSEVMFLSGYSGTGKSALVNEFIKQLQSQSASSNIFISGKYDELQNAAQPYSAISDALSTFCSAIADSDTEDSEVLRNKLRYSITKYCDGDMLSEVIKDLNKITGQNNTNTTSSINDKEKSFCKLRHSFLQLMKGLSSQERPLIMFLDDMQWIDQGSIELLSSLLTDKSFKYFMFIGSYRSNEVDQDHLLRGLISDVRKETEAEQVEMSDLSVEDVCEFIGDSLNLDAEEVRPLTEAVYNKTLGNIFFTREALEELVRKNGLYYDVMIFQWQWNISKIEIEDLLSDSVEDMVKSKIEHLPDLLQQALISASFTRSTFHLEILNEILDAAGYTISLQELAKLLDKAVFEGLLLNCVGTQEYTFAHDRIQEAAISFVSGDDKDQLRFHVANVLVNRISAGNTEDWMLFTAVHHFNSIPSHYLDEDAQHARIRLACLNLQAAKRSINKSAFSKAVESLRSGVDCLDKDARWCQQYRLCLDLYNHLLQTEFSLGNHDLAQAAVDEVLNNATSNIDKSLAQFYYIELITSRKDRNYALGAAKGIEFLAGHGINVATNPKDAKKMKEKKKLKSAMEGRSLLDLLDSPSMDDESLKIMRLLEQLSLCSVYTDECTCTEVSIIAQRLSFELGINKYLPCILPRYAILLRREGRWQEAFIIADAANQMLDKVCEGRSWARGMNASVGCISHLRQSFAGSIETFKEVHKVGFACGDIEWGCMGSMMYALCCFCSGRPINAIFQAKLVLFEEECQRFSQPPSVTVTFSIFRQFCLNLQGNENPMSLKGQALDEDEALRNLDGNTHKQTLRDIGIFRLILAYIYNDLSTCEEMIDRLQPYPEFDFPIARQHLRDVFMGLSAFLLASGRRGTKDKKKFVKIGREKLQLYQKLAKNKSENAPPVVLCLRAEEKPTRANYDKAISACSSSHLLHLQAIMNERCGVCLLGQKKNELAESYLSKAFWLFCEWGAMGKVNQLRQQYGFLKDVVSKRETHIETGTSEHSVASSTCLDNFRPALDGSKKTVGTRSTRSISSFSKTLCSTSSFRVTNDSN